MQGALKKHPTVLPEHKKPLLVVKGPLSESSGELNSRMSKSVAYKNAPAPVFPGCQCSLDKPLGHLGP